MGNVKSPPYGLIIKVLVFIPLYFLFFILFSPISTKAQATTIPKFSTLNFHPRVFNKKIDKAVVHKITKSGKASLQVLPTKPSGGGITPLDDSEGNSPLTYTGGNVIHTPHVHLIFWEPQYLSDQTTETAFYGDDFLTPTSYSDTESQYIYDLSTDTSSTYYKILTQYYDNTNGHISGNITFNEDDDVILDGDAMPDSDCTDSATSDNCIEDSDIQNEIASVAGYYGFGTGLNNVYIMYTPENQGVCGGGDDDACTFIHGTGDCGYHNVFSSDDNEYIYAMIPDNGVGDGTDCGVQYTPYDDPADYTSIDATSHELFEAITDPEAGYGSSPVDYLAWTVDNSDDNEVADVCVSYNSTDGYYILPTATYSSEDDDTYDADLELNGDYYAVPNMWSNYVLDDGDNTGCTLGTPPNDIVQGTIYQTKSVTTSVSPWPDQQTTVSIIATNAGDGTQRWDSADVSGGYSMTATHPYSEALLQSDPVVDSKYGLLYIIVYNISEGTGDLLAINTTTGHLEHDFDLAYVNISTPPVVDANGNVYFYGTDGYVYCYAKDGVSYLWRYNTGITGGSPAFTIDPTANILYFPDSDGNLYGIYDEIGAYPGSEYTSYYNTGYGNIDMNQPVAVDSSGIVYFGVRQTGGFYDSYILAYDPGDSTLVWATEVDSAVYGESGINSTIVGDGVVFANTEGGLYALSASDGANQWTTDPIHYAGYTESLGHNSLYLEYNGGLSSLDPSTGSINWTQNPFYSSWYSVPVVNTIDDGGIYTDTLFVAADIYTSDSDNLEANYALNSDGSVRFDWNADNVPQVPVLSLGGF